MSDLIEYVRAHAIRGECRCGDCLDRGGAPGPAGHTVDLVFFSAGRQGEPTAEAFRHLTRAHAPVYGAACDPLDGEQHGVTELGAFLGDQDLALLYMGLGTLLGIFELLTPKNMLPHLPQEMQMEIAKLGMVTVVAKSQRPGEAPAAAQDGRQ